MKSEPRDPKSERHHRTSASKATRIRLDVPTPAQYSAWRIRSSFAIQTSVLAITIILSCAAVSPAQSQIQEFVTARGDQLFEGDRPLRFISWNLPNLLIIEDNMPFAEPNAWRLPDQFELTDALATVRQMGGTVARTYVITVHRTNDAPNVPRHVLGPGEFNEEAFRTVDLALQVANEQGVRLILPLVCNWTWQGGRAEYAGFRGKTKDDFWTDPQLIEDFKKTIHFIITRTNTLTGVRYADDKAILCWETGNEVESPASWTREIAAYIKSLDPNHLVMDGYHASLLRDESLEIPEVDIVTTHHYPGGRKSFDGMIRANWAKAKGRKPYVVGEFGFVETQAIKDSIDAIQETGASGGLLWSLRFRNRDGGYYWHSEPAGGNRYKAFHWPGSDIGQAYDEVALMAMVRESAYAIRGLTPPPLPIPAPPLLLPIPNAAAISWRGSVGAAAYDVERAPAANGPWTVASQGVMEDFVQYRPLFVDETAPRGAVYYRVRAGNSRGVSAPSNVVGPVQVSEQAFVDEMSGFDRVDSRAGDWQIESRDCRQAKEDAHRAAGDVGATLVYQMPAKIRSARVFTFFPQRIRNPKFSVSSVGDAFKAVESDRHSYFEGGGDYDYWKPVEYRISELPPGARLLKIELTGETQIGRIEIDHDFD